MNRQAAQDGSAWPLRQLSTFWNSNQTDRDQYTSEERFVQELFSAAMQTFTRLQEVRHASRPKMPWRVVWQMRRLIQVHNKLHHLRL